jgi:phospho-N-acetylmuramoyl-pentapeptide-transferase
MIVKLAIAFCVSLGVSAVTGLFLIPYLRSIKAGQSIREDGPAWHAKKQGTPTMGGIMFALGTAAACFIAGIDDMRQGEFAHIYMLAFALVFAGIGFLDDYQKLLKKQNLGLTASQKLILQVVVAIVFVLLMRLGGYLTPNLYIPFANVTIPIPEVLYFAFAAFLVVATVNAANFTDGADGLCTGSTLPMTACFAAVAFLWSYRAIGIFAAGLCGGLVGFLLFNFYPAKIMMGDTGSHFLGGAVCALAFGMDMPLILFPLGIIYVIEMLSDLLQIGYFKATKGKRILKMAPLNHHLELCGWSEYKLFFVFSGISAVFAVISYFGVSARFLPGA